MDKLDKLLILMKAEGIIEVSGYTEDGEEKVALTNHFEEILQESREALSKDPKVHEDPHGCAIVLSILELCRGIGVTTDGIYQRANVINALLKERL